MNINNENLFSTIHVLKCLFYLPTISLCYGNALKYIKKVVFDCFFFNFFCFFVNPNFSKNLILLFCQLIPKMINASLVDSIRVIVDIFG